MVLCDPIPVSVPQRAERPQPALPSGRIMQLRLDAEALVFGGGSLRVRAAVAGTGVLTLWVSVAGERFEVPLVGGRTDTEVDLPSVLWWWPRGYGAQTRYPVLVSLLDERGEVVDVARRQVGFRWVQWDGPDAGEPSVLVVNGDPVRVRGLDWTGPAAADSLARTAAAANANLVRVHARARDDFYSRCDDLGLLVWQELRPPAEAEWHAEVAAIAHHPSLALFRGAGRLVGDLAPQVPFRSVEPTVAKVAGPAADPRVCASDDLRAHLVERRCDRRWWGGVLVTVPAVAVGTPGFVNGVRAGFADRAIVLRRTGEGMAVTVVNDTTEDWSGVLHLSRRSDRGEVLAGAELPIRVAARQNCQVPVPTGLLPLDGSGELVRAELGGVHDQWAPALIPAESRP